MWIVLGINFAEFERRVPTFQQFFSWPNVFLLWLTMGAAKFIHELGHGLACKHYGGECHEIGMAFMVFSPCLFCDVSDSWVLANKWKRIFIACAGMMIEVFLSALAMLAWWHSQPGLLHHLCLNMFMVTTITTVIFNANPLLRYDGYYILSDLLEIPNLRTKADRMFRECVQPSLLGDRTTRLIRSCPTAGEFGSRCSRWHRRVIAGFLRSRSSSCCMNFLKPYGLQNLGLVYRDFLRVDDRRQFVGQRVPHFESPKDSAHELPSRSSLFVSLGRSGIRLLDGSFAFICRGPVHGGTARASGTFWSPRRGV